MNDSIKLLFISLDIGATGTCLVLGNSVAAASLYERYYLWLAIDSETRFILAFHLTKSRSSDSAYTLINEAKKCGKPTYFITDRLPSLYEGNLSVIK